jgi:hypothetical protein
MSALGVRVFGTGGPFVVAGIDTHPCPDYVRAPPCGRKRFVMARPSASDA